MPDEQTTTRRCTKCGESKLMESFYRSPRRNGAVVAQCKSCTNARNAKWIKAHPESQLRHSRKNQKHSAQWLKSHPEKAKEYRARHMAKPGVREAHRDKSREKRRANAGAINARYRELRQLRPEIYRNRDARRKALEIEAQIGITPEDLVLIERFYHGVYEARTIRCYWCRRPVPRAKREVDHIVPLSRGGKHTAINLCCSCGSCNRSKCAKMPEEVSGQQEMFT